jgi:hypothetical protein
MGNRAQLILRHGVENAEAMAETKADRQAIEAAAAILADEESRMGITHAGFAMTSLPHKRIEEAFWRRDGHKTTLLVESGRDRRGTPVGVPYGSIARLILLYLQTEAVRTNSPEVELGRSMKSWMGRMSLTTGGKTYQLVAEQARRISGLPPDLLHRPRERRGEPAQRRLRPGRHLPHRPRGRGQPTLWQDRVRLDDGFWRSLRDHPVPVREEAIRASGTRSLAIDVYVWLAYRLHSLARPAPISWTAVHGQFGAGFRLVRQIKPTFLDALKLALAVYPEARVDADKEGIVLHPSLPAVRKAEARQLGLT